MVMHCDSMFSGAKEIICSEIGQQKAEKYTNGRA